MKLIELEILCRDIEPEETDENNQSYKAVLEELNLKTDEEHNTFWKIISFNLQVLNDELFSIEPRVDHEDEHSIVTFFNDRTLIVNQERSELTKFLNDTNQL